MSSKTGRRNRNILHALKNWFRPGLITVPWLSRN